MDEIDNGYGYNKIGPLFMSSDDASLTKKNNDSVISEAEVNSYFESDLKDFQTKVDKNPEIMGDITAAETLKHYIRPLEQSKRAIELGDSGLRFAVKKNMYLMNNPKGKAKFIQGIKYPYYDVGNYPFPGGTIVCENNGENRYLVLVDESGVEIETIDLGPRD